MFLLKWKSLPLFLLSHYTAPSLTHKESTQRTKYVKTASFWSREIWCNESSRRQTDLLFLSVVLKLCEDSISVCCFVSYFEIRLDRYRVFFKTGILLINTDNLYVRFKCGRNNNSTKRIESSNNVLLLYSVILEYTKCKSVSSILNHNHNCDNRKVQYIFQNDNYKFDNK